MARNNDNVVSITMAVVLHGAIFASMFAAFDWASPAPFTPMAIRATLVMDIPDTAPPPEPVVEKAPEPEPEIEEPPPEPDNSAELQRAAEEKKRVQDALIEKDRLEEIRKREEAERQQKVREAQERKKAEEEQKEQERQQAERKRQEDIQRQREENERLRLELEAEERAQEIDDEERRLAANDSPAMAAYIFAISQKIRRNWSMPASANADTVCIVNVRQVAGGQVVSVNVSSCNNGGDAAVRAAEAAIWKASPLPEPSDPDVFRPKLEFFLRPE